MEIKNLKELKELLDLLKRKGIKDFSLGNMKIVLSDDPIVPISRNRKKEKLESNNPYSEDEVLFWSNTGLPDGQGVA